MNTNRKNPQSLFPLLLSLLAGVLLGLQPVAAALNWTSLNWLEPYLDSAPYESPVFLGLAGLGLLAAALWLYARTLDSQAIRRSRWRVVLSIAPFLLLGAGVLAGWDYAANSGWTILGLAGVPAILIVLPLLLLLAESVVRRIAAAIGEWAAGQGWRHVGAFLLTLALRLRPDARPVLRAAGLLLAEEDRFEQAAALFDKLEPTHAMDDEELLRAAERSYRALNRREEATACLQALLALRPGSRMFGLRLMDDLVELGRPQDALALIERSELLDGFERVRRMTKIHREMGEYAKAFDLIRALDVQDGTTRTMAIGLSRELLKTAPMLIDVRVYLGRLLIKAESNKESQQGARLLEEALVQEPELPELRRELIACYEQMHQTALALPHYRKLIDDEIAEAPVYLTYCQALMAGEEYEEAERVLRRLIVIAPECGEGILRLARLLVRNGRPEDAEAILARAQERLPVGEREPVRRLREEIDAARRSRQIEGAVRRLNDTGGAPEERLTLIREAIGLDRIDLAIQQSEMLLAESPDQVGPLQGVLAAGIGQAEDKFRLCDYLADLYFREDRYDEVMRLYHTMAEKSIEPLELISQGCRKILRRAPGHRATRLELARVRRRAEDWPGVIEALDPLLDAKEEDQPLAPADAAMWVEAAWRAGRIDDAARRGCALVADLAGDTHFMLMLVEILQAAQDFQGAWEVWAEARAAQPDDGRLAGMEYRLDRDRHRQRIVELRGLAAQRELTPPEHFEMGELHQYFEEFEDAIIQYQRASLADDLARPALANMAVALCERGLYDVAAETMEEVQLTREIDALHPEVKERIYAVAEVMEKQKRFDLALEYYKRIFRIDAAFRDVVVKLQRFG